MFYMNEIRFLGRAVKDAELKQLPNSDSRVASFRLVSNRRIKKKNAPKDATGKDAYEERATYVDVEVWQQKADYASQYVKRGTPVLVEGQLETDEWTTADGSKRSKLKIYGNRIQAERVGVVEDDAPTTEQRAQQRVPAYEGNDLPF